MKITFQLKEICFQNELKQKILLILYKYLKFKQLSELELYNDLMRDRENSIYCLSKKMVYIYVLVHPSWNP